MSYTRRGLSDVVTTVLIILLVVVAVVAISAYVRTSVDQTGKTVERTGICLTNMIEVTGCRYLDSGSATLTTKRTTDDATIASVSSLKAAYKATNGNTETVDVAPAGIPASNGAIASGNADFTIATIDPVTAPDVTLIAEFTLKNGNKVTCPGNTLTCTKQ